MTRIHKTAEIGEQVKLRPNCSVGANTIIKCCSVIGTNVTVGADCFLGPGVLLLYSNPLGTSEPCMISDRVFIGAGVSVLPGVKICSGTIIGAGAVIIKDIAEPGTYAGTPCKKISDKVFDD